MKFEDTIRSPIIKISLISIIFLSVSITLLLLVQKKTPPDTSNALIKVKEEYYREPLKIMGLKQRTYNNGKLTTLVEADEFKVRPRKHHFLFNMSPIINIKPIFNIRPFNEAILKNAKFEVHLYPEISAETGLFFIGKNMVSSDLQGMGIVTRVLIEGLIMDIYKDDILSLVVEADKARIHIRKKEVKLINATIKDMSSQKHITSRLIIWNEKEKVFKIPGPYIAVTPKGKATGTGINLDLDFNATPFFYRPLRQQP